MIDRYFRQPLVYDYFITLVSCAMLYYLYLKEIISLPIETTSISMSTDVSTIALTLAGFVLTLLTVLITFKTGAKIVNNSNQEDLPLFDLFFSTPLYFKTVDLLKGAIISLVFVAVVGFGMKLILRGEFVKYIFFANVLGLFIITVTLWRSLLILTKIVNLQKEG